MVLEISSSCSVFRVSAATGSQRRVGVGLHDRARVGRKFCPKIEQKFPVAKLPELNHFSFQGHIVAGPAIDWAQDVHKKATSRFAAEMA
jgi:hypothetical protein